MSNLSRSAFIRLCECAGILARQASKNKSNYMMAGNEELNEKFSTRSRLES